MPTFPDFLRRDEEGKRNGESNLINPVAERSHSFILDAAPEWPFTGC
jgi:hypothetical protein